MKNQPVSTREFVLRIYLETAIELLKQTQFANCHTMLADMEEAAAKSVEADILYTESIMDSSNLEPSE